MEIRKFIHWRKDMTDAGSKKTFANIHILRRFSTAYNLEETVKLAEYQQMAEELRKDFPEATDTLIGVSRVRGGEFDGWLIVVWNSDIPLGDYPGWTQDNENILPFTW